MSEPEDTPTGPEMDEDEQELGDDEKEQEESPIPYQKPERQIKGRRVQTFGKKKKAIALAICGDGYGMIRVNGRPLDCIQPEPLRLKVYEPFLLVGKDKFQDLDIHVRVKGGGQVAQIYGMHTFISSLLLLSQHS